MKNLTRAEEQVMKIVWSMNGGLLMEIVEQMPEPKPHKNTVATILKILTEKDFINVQSEGRVNTYLPKVSRDSYSKSTLTQMTKNYFNNSFTDVVSFLMDEKKISVAELERLLREKKSLKKIGHGIYKLSRRNDPV